MNREIERLSWLVRERKERTTAGYGGGGSGNDQRRQAMERGRFESILEGRGTGLIR